MKKLKLIIIIAFLFTFLWQFLRIEVWDYDFWWHIATGRYILSTHYLPDKDPFSYTSTMEENRNLYPERENFILKQYWLSQIIFYLVYNHTGPKGIIILRSLLYIMTIIIVLWRLQRWNVSLPITFISIFTLFMVIMSRLTGERPVLFTILFTALTFFILEDFKEKKDRRIYFLSPLMLLWSNLHGGFILGVAIVLIFMAGEGLKIILRKTTLTKHEIALFYAASFLSLGFSFVNPTGWDAFAIAFSSKYKIFTQGIQEYTSPFVFYFKERLSPVNYWFISLVILFPIVLIIRNRKIDLTHIILLLFVSAMSISAIRFETYYGIIGAMVLAREIDTWIKYLFKARLSESMQSKLFNWLTAGVLFSLILYMIGSPLLERPSFTAAHRFSIPKNAVDFIEKNKLSGNMFNAFGYGGYITWRLPKEKTFIDSRALNMITMSEYGWIERAFDSIYSGKPSAAKGPLWERLMNHYDINYAILSVHDVHGTVVPLVFKLAESEKWTPVYMDMISIIFVRNTSKNKDISEKYILPKEDIYNVIIYQSSVLALSNAVNPRSLLSLGNAFHNVGRLDDALAAYRYAMNRLPSPKIQEKINQIESEIKIREEERMRGIKNAISL